MRLGSLLMATTATTTVAGRVIQIQENLSDKSISIGSFRHKQPQNSHRHRMPNRLNSSREPTDRPSNKEPNDKVQSLFGQQQSQTNSEFGQIYRVTCWEATGNARAGCIYQAPNKFRSGSVSHFWLSSESHKVRWIHFYDANVIPGSSNQYDDDYAIAHTDPNYNGVDFVNFIVMFENVDETASSIPDDSDWIVFSDPEETYDTAIFSFPSNYEGSSARTSIKTTRGHFNQDDIVLIKFPSAVKNLHFDLIDGMQILGVEEPGNYAETVTLTNIPRYITEIWFDFEYLDTVKENGIDPVGNWFDATTMTVNIY